MAVHSLFFGLFDEQGGGYVEVEFDPLEKVLS